MRMRSPSRQRAATASLREDGNTSTTSTFAGPSELGKDIAAAQKAATDAQAAVTQKTTAKQQADAAVSAAEASQQDAVDALTGAQETFKSQQAELDRLTAERQQAQAKLAEANVATKVRATPLLASAIEEGFHNGTISEAVVNAYFADQWTAGTEALILACTHYPLAMDQIMEVLNEPLKVVHGPAIVADAVAEALAHRGLVTPEDAPLGRRRFEVTDWTESFAQGAKHIMQSDLNLQEVGWTTP